MPPKRPVVSDDESDYDDIDELVSDEEDEKVSGVAALLKGSLSMPRHVTTSVEHVNRMIQQGDVELNPSYQRDVVWPEVKMIMLIQSLFLNYYIPPLIFAIEPDPDTMDEKRICIDGKQRCTSIANFMMGVIPYISPYTKERYWYVRFNEKQRGKQLPPALRKKFDNIQLFMVEYRDITDQQQRDVFQRVQMGVSLSAAEKLAAIPGPWPTWVVELQKKYVGEPGTLGTAIDFDQNRGRPFQILAGFVLMAFDDTKTGIPSAQQLNKFLHRADPPDRHFKHKIEMALSLFVNIATEHHEASFGVVSQRVAPVEWVFSALLIFSRMGVLSVNSLAAAIGRMRTYIRHDMGHRDVRSNTRVSADLYEYLRKLPKSRQNGEVPAAEEFEGDEVDPRDIRAAKRARRGEDADPTYRETATDRYDEAGLGRATRAQKTVANGSSAGASTSAATTSRTNRPAPVDVKPNINDHAFPPTPVSAPPPPPAMDRPMPSWTSINPHAAGGNGGGSGGFGGVPPGMQSTNPYTQRYHNAPNGQQQQQHPQAPFPLQQQQQHHQAPQQQYTPQQMAQFQAMQANQAKQQAAASGGPRWAAMR